MTARTNLVHPTPIADLAPGRPAMAHGVVVRFGCVFERFSRGRMQPVRTVLLRDATGEVPLALWGEEVGHLREADRVLLVEAWVSEYRGQPELTLGSRGYLVNLGPASGRGPVWRPGPKDGSFVWGLVRRRLRERGLRQHETRQLAATSGPTPPEPQTPPSEVAHAP
jgi:hypothetical protein